MKILSFPHETNITKETVFHNGGKVWKIHIKAYLCGYPVVYKRVLQIFILNFSTVFRFFHTVDFLSTYYPRYEICGKMWKTDFYADITCIFKYSSYVEKKDIHNFHMDFIHM